MHTQPGLLAISTEDEADHRAVIFHIWDIGASVADHLDVIDREGCSTHGRHDTNDRHG